MISDEEFIIHTTNTMLKSLSNMLEIKFKQLLKRIAKKLSKIKEREK